MSAHELQTILRRHEVQLSMKNLFKFIFSKFHWYSSAKHNLCVLRWPYEEKDKTEFTIPISLKATVSKLLFLDALPGICCSLVFQFGRSLVDVAAENHDRGKLVNPWHKNSPGLMSLHFTHVFEDTFPITVLWASVVMWQRHSICSTVFNKLHSVTH